MKSIYKILLITDNQSQTGGGAEKVFFSMMQALQNFPELSVFSLGFGAENKTSKDTIIIKETSCAVSRLGWRMFFNPYKYWQIRGALKKINPDVIHLHNVKKYTISLLKAVQGYPVIQTVHDFTSICPTGWNVHQDLQPCATGLQIDCIWRHKRDLAWPIYLGALFAFKRMRALLKKSVKHFIAPSPMLQDYLQRNGFKPCDYLPPLRDEASSTDMESMREKHFLYIGQLGKHKGVATLINEFAIACQAMPDLTLSIAGIGSEEKSLRELVKKLKLENNINFLGWVKPAELYSQAMALIFPSVGLESFGLVITEAMQHSRVVIGAARGPTPWLVGDTGLLFDPLKKGDLAGKILLLARDKNLAQELGRKAFVKVQTLMSNQDVMDKTVALYKLCCSDTP